MFCHECVHAVGFHPGDKQVVCDHPYYKPRNGEPPYSGCFCGTRRPTLQKDKNKAPDDMPGQGVLFDGIE